jgi:transposase
MGRSRGGLTTKIHALVDANGLPVALKLTEGQAHDGRSAADMLQGLGAGQILIADRAYDSDLLRQNMTARGESSCFRRQCRRGQGTRPLRLGA